MDDSVFKLLEELEQAIDEGRSVPFSNRIQVDKEELFSIIDDIKNKLPNEIKQSKWVIEERNKILIDAQKEAEEMMKDAEVRLSKLVDENTVTKKAYEQASAIIDSTKKSAREMRLGAVEYADEVLSLAEDRLKEMMSVVQQESIRTDEFFKENVDTLFANRQELRGNKK